MTVVAVTPLVPRPTGGIIILSGWTNGPARWSLLRIVLEKHTASPGSMPIGERYEWTYVSGAPEQARSRAWRALKRDHPGENPMCWREVEA